MAIVFPNGNVHCRADEWRQYHREQADRVTRVANAYIKSIGTSDADAEFAHLKLQHESLRAIERSMRLYGISLSADLD